MVWSSLRLCSVVLVLLAADAAPASAQHLKDGDWVGRIIHLTGRSMEVHYQVRTRADSLRITMVVEDFGPFEFSKIRATRDSLRFTWEPSFELACSLARLDDGMYQGACMDPWGGFGGIVMAPPGTDIDAIALHDETIESIAGWTEPPSGDTLPSLGDTYPLGQVVTVLGRKANLVAQGEGPVTVVLEAGLGDNLASWEQLHRLLVRHTRVVAYDRAGFGHSESSDAARTPEQVAVELRGLLREARVPPPYVLVAHAEGALYARRFAALYGDAVRALVLVDPHLETLADMWRALDDPSWQRYWEQRKAFYLHLPQPLRAEFAAYARIIDSGKMTGTDAPLELPVTVLTAARASQAPQWVGEAAKGRQAWERLHADWAEAVGAAHIVVNNSGTYIHQEQPVRVLQAILARIQ